MTPRARLSENGKLIVFCLLFPLFWPFLPVLLIGMACESIRDAYWERKYRKAIEREDAILAEADAIRARRGTVRE